jgi:hypothetical protein
MIHPWAFALSMVALNGAGGQTVYVNPLEITVITGPSVVQLAEHVHCVVGLTNGKFVSTEDDCDTVQAKIQQAEGK